MQRCGGGKDGIDVGAEGDKAPAVAGANAKNIADFVDLNINEAELAKTIGEPRAAGGFSEGGRGDARGLHLPERELRFLGPEALEGGAHFQRASESRYFFLQRGIRIRGCHLRNELHPWLFYNVIGGRFGRGARRGETGFATPR